MFEEAITLNLPNTPINTNAGSKDSKSNVLDIELACHTGPWGDKRLITSLSEIESGGYKGIETNASVVDLFEDRISVFNEILKDHHLKLIAITAPGSTWPGMNLEEEVERGINIARFLQSSGSTILTLMPPRPVDPDEPIEDELDILPAATAYGEIARRTLELGVITCLHPEIGSCVETIESMDKFIQMADPEAMKVCVDSAYLAQAGVPYEDFIRENKKRIGMVHLRDMKKPKATKKGEGEWKHVPLGKGDLELELFVDTLLSIEYSGWATVEPVDDSRDMVRQVKSAFDYAGQTLDLVL